MTPGLRPAGPGHAEWLFQIYASTRADELAAVGWDAAAKDAFLRVQFSAQERYYHAAFPAASYDLIVRGADVLGRFYLDRTPARRLYDRLGFRQVDDQGVYLLLEREPRLEGEAPARLGG